MTAQIETKLIKLMTTANQRYGLELTPDGIIRDRLSSEIKKGMETAFAGCRDLGETIVFRMLGMTKDWNKLKVDKGSPLLKELRNDFEPEVLNLAFDIAKDIRESGKLKLTKKDMAQIRSDVISDYRSNVRAHVRELMEQETKRAEHKAKDIFARIPKMLDGTSTFDDIIAEQFTEMLAQDVELQKQHIDDARTEARNHMRAYALREDAKTHFNTFTL